MSVPATILCGGLGAGKTTLLSRLLETVDRDVAVLVNDFGDVNVGEIPTESREGERGVKRPVSDADLVEARTDLETGEEVVALENGCICCSLGGELSRSVIRLARRHEFDHLVVEASGVGEPEPIARQFVRGPAAGSYDLDSVVTVVDARAFHDAFVDVEADSGEQPTRAGVDDTGSRPLADLWLEQVEFCDLLVVNKCDLVDEDERDRVGALLETLQPRAETVTTEYGRLDPDVVLENERFDLETAAASAGWKRALEADEDDHGHSPDRDHEDGTADHHHEHQHGHDHDHEHDHDHQPERYGIEVETYHRRRPVHPERFAALLEDLPAGLVRAKGLCWIAGRERQAITMSLAGRQTTLEVTGRWIASLSEERREVYRRGQPDLAWDEEWGDREVRLALIGRNLDFDDLFARLDDCLLTDREMDRMEEWRAWENPAPTGTGETRSVSSQE
ncbi:CobW family GTP-binding protein [Natrialbaceae archaeon GCM10025810]|uniref:CobW family GTP-binding protein n=1 Tax=Halovalidus salilacus TaxID=3075124 RepID=UPI00361456A5